MKIAYVTLFDATDVQNWSGTYFHLWKSLEAQGLQIELVGNLRHGPSLARKARKLWGTKVERRTFLHFWDTDTAKAYAADVASRIQNLQVDAIVSPTPVPLAYLSCPQPKILWTDATYAALRQNYEEFSPKKTCTSTAKSAMQIDRAVARKCDRLIYASEWGAEWAIKDTGAAPDKVSVVPFGANIQVDHTLSDVEQVVENRGTKNIKLLFVGVEWERKGAAKAINVTRRLHQCGVQVELAIVGCTPPAGEIIPPFVRLLGFISKTTAEGKNRLFELYRESHFLIVPTTAEAYGLVFAEASAFGIPSLSHRVGGVTTVVHDGVNGQLFDIVQPVEDWSDWMLSVLQTPNGLRNLSLSSFKYYQDRLNWDVAGGEAASLIRATVSDKEAPKHEVIAG